MQFCTFTLDDMLFGIGVGRVKEVIRAQRMAPVPLAPGAIAGLINLRGQIVTAIDLRRRLELPPRDDDAPSVNVVVRMPDGAVSLLVDEIGDVIDTSDDSFEPPPDTLSGTARDLIRGTHKLDGRLLLALDTNKVVHVVPAPTPTPTSTPTPSS